MPIFVRFGVELRTIFKEKINGIVGRKCELFVAAAY